MDKRNLIYEGKAKRVYSTDNENEVIIYYKDTATAFNGAKKAIIENKGILNNQISALIFAYLKHNEIKTHFIRKINEREQLCEKVDIIKLEVIIRNIAAGSLTKRLGIPEGTVLTDEVYELSYKNDELNDPLINEDHALALNIASKSELQEIKIVALKVNHFLKVFLAGMNIRLVDFKIEFGKNSKGEIVLADEITPDTCRLWDISTNESLDKDRFRKDLGNVSEAYIEVLHRLESDGQECCM